MCHVMILVRVIFIILFPQEWQKRQIFSSHYDEGRLTRELEENLIWGTLAQRSIQRYRQIEEESGECLDSTA